MKRNHIIAMDTHCQWTEGVVMTEGGRITHRWQVPTTIPDLAEKITSVRHPRDVVFEEGPLADWLLRGLQPLADRIVVADPRRNHLIAKDSDKDDAIDAEKLAHLYRGGYIKPVHHPASWDRLVLKRQVALYHHQVKQRVRQANRIISELRHYGVMVREAAFRDPADRPGLLAPLPNDRAVRAGLECLWRGYDGAVEQGRQMGRELTRLARGEPQVRRFAALPGVKWIRGSTFLAYVDTPWRFRSKQALWKYLGIGLERRSSGSGPERVRVVRGTHRRLKNMILGAAESAIRGRDNPFAEQWRRWTDQGVSPRIARRNVARSLAAVMWGLWKNDGVYRPEWVGLAATGRPGPGVRPNG